MANQQELFIRKRFKDIYLKIFLYFQMPMSIISQLQQRQTSYSSTLFIALQIPLLQKRADAIL